MLHTTLKPAGRAAILMALFGWCVVPVIAQKVTTVPVAATRLIYDPVSKKIYASVGNGGKGDLLNSVTVIDPRSGKVGPTVPLGTEPGALALSDKSKYLYVALNGGRTIRRIDLDTMTPGIQFPVGETMTAAAMVSVPDKPEGVIVMRHAPEYRHNVASFVDGKLLKSTSGAGASFQPGLVSSRVYTYQDQISSWDFTVHQWNSEGVRQVANVRDILSGHFGLATSVNGLIISGNGSVVDPEARQVIGSLQTGMHAHLCGDASTGIVFQIEGEKTDFKLTGHDLRTFRKLGTVSISVPGGTGGAGSLIRWGDNGLAFTAGEVIALVQMDLGPKLPSIDLSVKRSTLPATLPREGTLKYTLTVTNNSLARSTGAFLTDAVPSGVEVAEVKTSQGSGFTLGGIVRAELGPLAPKAKATVEVTLNLKGPGENGFGALVRGLEPDPTPENNLAVVLPVSAARQLADLSGSWQGLRQFSQGAGVNLRAAIVGTLLIRNDGRQDSRVCVVRFYLAGSPGFNVATSQLLQEVEIPGLRRGDSYRVGLEAPLGPGDDATGLFLFAVIDATNSNEETEKGNNILRTRIP